MSRSHRTSLNALMCTKYFVQVDIIKKAYRRNYTRNRWQLKKPSHFPPCPLRRLNFFRCEVPHRGIRGSPATRDARAPSPLRHHILPSHSTQPSCLSILTRAASNRIEFAANTSEPAYISVRCATKKILSFLPGRKPRRRQSNRTGRGRRRKTHHLQPQRAW